MNERIKILRKHLKLSQTEFGKKTKTSLSAVQKWESGENTPTAAVIALMVSQWHVSEDWLRTGEGEMFEEVDPDEELMRFVGQITKDDNSPLYRLAQKMAQMPPEVMEHLCAVIDYALKQEGKDG